MGRQRLDHFEESLNGDDVIPPARSAFRLSPPAWLSHGKAARALGLPSLLRASFRPYTSRCVLQAEDAGLGVRFGA